MYENPKSEIENIDGELKFNDRTSIFERDIVKEKAPKFSYLTKFFKYVFSSAKTMCSIFLGLAVILSVIQPVLAFIWGKYIDGANNYSENGNIAFLIILMLVYWLGNFVIDLLYQYLYGGESIQKLDIVQNNRLQEKFRTKLYKKLSSLHPEYMEVPRINDIIQRSFNSLGDEWGGLQKGVIVEGYNIIAKIVSVVMVTLALYIFSPILCMIILVVPIPTLYTTYIGNRLSFRFVRDNDKILREAGYYQSIMLGSAAKEVKTLNLFDFFFTKWKVIADNYIIRERKNQINIFILGTINTLITNSASMTANILAIILMTQGVISVGELAAVMVLIGTLISNTSHLFGSIASFISKKNEATQFFEFIDLNEQISGEKTVEKLDTLEIDNVSFRYPLTNIHRIKNTSFSLQSGEKIAFVGENGAGKTTFIKLITGMLEPSEGSIIINGASVDDINCRSRYDAMTGVFQEPARFNTFTVADNVFLGDTLQERKEDVIDNSLEFAGFERIGKSSLLGKDIGGTDLSGGQWQKIAIARAYYRNRDFIILDEPTSNLDPFAETEIFKKYITMSRDKTLIVVTHRISVASLADRIIVFKDGGIVEDGVHQDLLSNNGEYSRLYHTQAEWYNR